MKAKEVRQTNFNEYSKMAAHKNYRISYNYNMIKLMNQYV